MCSSRRAGRGLHIPTRATWPLALISPVLHCEYSVRRFWVSVRECGATCKLDYLGLLQLSDVVIAASLSTITDVLVTLQADRVSHAP
jgi:hypothetical protein